MIPTVEALAFAMYERNALTFVTATGPGAVGVQKFWNDSEELRAFWIAEATFVMEFLDVAL